MFLQSNKSSPAAIDSDFSEKSSNANKSNSLKDVDEKHFNRNYSSLSNQEFGNRQSEQQSSHHYLKDSKIKEMRNPDSYRRPLPNIENLQNPSGRQSYNSAPQSDYSLSKKSMDLKYPPEYGHQKYADRKYPGFEDRPYFSDRERSRPSSRSSIDDRSEDYRYPSRPGDFYGQHDDRRRGSHPEYARPPSRCSESDMNISDRRNQYDYYKGQYSYNMPYSRNNDYYNRPPNYRGKYYFLCILNLKVYIF